MTWVAGQLRQICADYNITVPLQEITIDEVRFFYMPMIDSLCKIQKELSKRK